MARVNLTVRKADGSTTIPLHNVRGKSRTIYSVYVSGDFGGGTITAFLQADGTNDVPIKDSAGVAISIASDDMFNFEAYSDPTNVVKLLLFLNGSTNPSLNLNIYNNS